MNEPEKRTHHTVQSRDTDVAPGAVELSLAIQSPDRLQLVTDLIAEHSAVRVACVTVSCSKDDHVGIEMRSVVELDPALIERRDLGIILQLDLALGDKGRRPDIYG